MKTHDALNRNEQTAALKSRTWQSWKTLDSLVEGIQIIDFNWRYVYVNNTIARHGQTTKEEFIGHTVEEMYPNIEQTDFFTALERCMTDREPQQLQNQFLCLDKSKRWFELSIEPIEEGIFILSLDITAQHKAEEKNNKANHLHAFISQVNQEIVRVKDEQTLFRNACKMAVVSGKFKMAWVGIFDKQKKNISLVEQGGMAEEDLKEFSNLSYIKKGPQQSVLNSGTYYICNNLGNEPELEIWKSFALRHGLRSWIVLPLKISGETVGTLNLYATESNFSGEGEIALLVEIAGDISFALDLFEKAKRQKQTEELLVLSEKRFRALIEKSADMISLVTAAGEVTYCSPSVTKCLGYSMGELLHKRDIEFIHPDDIESFEKNTIEILQTSGRSFICQQRLLHNNGSWLWCEGTVTNMLDEAGVRSIVSNFRDISEKKLMEQHQELIRNKLIQQNAELQKTNAELDQFVYSASHDLRSPLSSILGLVTFIEKETKETNTLEYAKMILSSINRLDGFIKNILSYSRNNRTEIEPQEIYLQETINEIVDALRNMKEAEGLTFEVNVLELHPFYSDRQRFRIVLEHLISNAIKFKDHTKSPKYIKITGQSDEVNLQLSVEDNGIGIASEFQPKIFDMFFRISGHISGSGIGLYIVRETIRKLQGTINFKSEEGLGSTFTITMKNLVPIVEKIEPDKSSSTAAM